MNSKGQLYILDLIFYLIIITIIIGLVLYTFSVINNNQIEKVESQETKELVANILTMLVKTEGVPSNWDNLTNMDDISTIGLRSNSSTNLISFNKLMKLKENSNLLNRYISHDLDYSLLLIDEKTNNQVVIAGKDSLSNKKNVYAESVSIIIDYGYDIYTIDDTNQVNSCQLNHLDGWSCRNITLTNDSAGKYYLITNNSRYILTNSYGEMIESNVYKMADITAQLNQLIHNSSDTIIIHVENQKNDTYLVYDKYNHEEYLNSIYSPDIYKLKLEIST